jgi:hypothetical protein
LGLIDPILEEARSGYIARVVAKAVYGAHPQDQSFFILEEFAQHISGVNVARVVIRESLQACDVPDGPYRSSTYLPYAFGYLIGDGEHLIRMIVEEQMVVAKMRAAHVPVKVLRFQVKREHVRKQSVESS